MSDFFRELFSSDFMPHGYCYLWRPELVWLHSVSDGVITFSYYLIPFLLVYFVRKRDDLPFNWMFVMFGVFIFGCGTTHLMEIWTLWHGTYGLSGVVKAVTALASVGTAITLIPIIPKALALPSPNALHAEINDRLKAERALNDAKHELEHRVQERTTDLQMANDTLSSEIEQRRRVEAELRQVEAVLRRHEQELEGLAGKLITVQEDERKRIARDLHDDFAQRLALHGSGLDVVLQRLDPASDIAHELARLRRDGDQLMFQVREISHNWHHPQLALGFLHGARSFCVEFSEQHDIVVDLTSRGDHHDIPGPLSIVLFRVMQEALSNVAKHSAAERCLVALQVDDDRIQLHVVDEGRGFEPHGVNHEGGLGLISMRERLRLVHGTMEVISAPGQGTEIVVIIPMALPLAQEQRAAEC